MLNLYCSKKKKPMNCYITFEYLATLKWRQLILAEYNTNIIHRLYQTIEKRDRCPPSVYLRWLNTVLAVSEYRSFVKMWQEKGCSSQAETWQVRNLLMKEFDWQVKFDVFVVSMATWTIKYNLKISPLLSLHKIRSLDFPINSHTAYYN